MKWRLAWLRHSLHALVRWVPHPGGKVWVVYCNRHAAVGMFPPWRPLNWRRNRDSRKGEQNG